MTKDSSSSSSSLPPPLHPAQTVGNIKHDIPLILDLEKVNYSMWAELFKTHCHAYGVHDHINPKTTRPSHVSEDLWLQLDHLVKKWIYNTITPDFTQTIITKRASAQHTWEKLCSIFQDNKSTRALYLENQLNNVYLGGHKDVPSWLSRILLLNFLPLLRPFHSPVVLLLLPVEFMEDVRVAMVGQTMVEVEVVVGQEIKRLGLTLNCINNINSNLQPLLLGLLLTLRSAQIKCLGHHSLGLSPSLHNLKIGPTLLARTLLSVHISSGPILLQAS